MNRQQMMAAAAELLSAREDDVPEGAFSKLDYAEAQGISPDTATYRLNSLVHRKGWNTGKAYRRSTDGRMTLQRVYWPPEAEAPE